MAPIKFEDNIREKLQERELTPSADAWKKLEGRLDSEPKNNRKGFFWIGMAATVTGVLLVVSFFLNQNSSEINENLLVNEDTTTEKVEQLKTSEEIKPEVKIDEIKSEEIASEETTIQESNQETIKNTPSNKQTIEKKQIIIAENPVNVTNDAVAKVEDKKEEPIQKIENSVVDITKSFEEMKLEEVVALIEKGNTTMSVEEIDLLLAEAQREIRNKKMLDQASGKIDATALLNDVEFELERSFRDRVFDALGDQFNKVRTAVSERNN